MTFHTASHYFNYHYLSISYIVQTWCLSISDIVQTAALSDHSKLEGIIKSNPNTLANLDSQVLTFDLDPDPEADPQALVRYLMVRLATEEEAEGPGMVWCHSMHR